MPKTRLEAFSDGVIAIILTIMVLELKVPKEQTLDALAALQHIDRAILVANGLLLFAASLVPFATAFAGEAHWGAAVPVASYGLVMVFVSLAFARLRTLASRCAGTPEVGCRWSHSR